MNTETEQSLSIRAAWLAYVGGQTQEQIASHLGISRIKVQRLIAAALRGGAVKFFVEGVPAECMALEQQLIARYGLHRCAVVPTIGEERDAAIAALAVEAARQLTALLESGSVSTIGVGHGRTLAAMVDRLPAISKPDVQFVSLLGSLTRRSAANPFDLIARLAERTQGECYFMPVPFLADSEADAEVLRAQRGVQHVFTRVRACEICIVGIGELGAGAQLLANHSITAQELQVLTAAGAVGEIAGCFVDRHGQPVDCDMNRRAVGASLDDLRGRDVLAVAGGRHKAQAIRAVLRTDIITELIVDHQAAHELATAT